MRICIVGNARSILERELGAEIDNHDTVVRCNCFSTLSKWSRYVGTQTNVWAVSMQLNTPAKMKPFFGAGGFGFVRGLREVWTHRPSYPQGAIDGFREMVKPWNFPPVVPVSEKAIDEARQAVPVPSTGYVALLTALDRYPEAEVSVVGFGPINEMPQWEAGAGSYDYWTYSTDVEHARFYEPPTKQPYRTVHDFNSEWEDMKRRAAEAQIQILTEPRSFSELVKRSHPHVVIVGNSDELLTAERGELIDAHEIVVRCNSFVTAGHEKHTGSKTHVWALSTGKDSNMKLDRFIAAHDLDLSFVAGLTAVWIPFENVRHRQEFAQHIRRLAATDQAAKGKIEFTLPSVCKQVHSAYKNPSTGLIVLFKAMDRYKVPIAIVGFGRPQDKPRHYYSPGQTFETGQRYGIEADIIERLRAAGKVVVL